jgi:hypothetical protein
LAPFLEANRLALDHWTKVSDAMVMRTLGFAGWLRATGLASPVILIRRDPAQTPRVQVRRRDHLSAALAALAFPMVIW